MMNIIVILSLWKHMHHFVYANKIQYSLEDVRRVLRGIVPVFRFQLCSYFVYNSSK